jgi:hypothetical protein
MDREFSPATSFTDDASGESTQQGVIEEKRRYIRDYMRQWRSRPEHQQVERRNRRRCYHRRRARGSEDALHPSSNPSITSICGICRKRPSVTTIVRLRLLDKSPYNYAEMRVPYCGEC